MVQVTPRMTTRLTNLLAAASTAEPTSLLSLCLAGRVCWLLLPALHNRKHNVTFELDSASTIAMMAFASSLQSPRGTWAHTFFTLQVGLHGDIEVQLPQHRVHVVVALPVLAAEEVADWHLDESKVVCRPSAQIYKRPLRR
jgi:hypothetical protein